MPKLSTRLSAVPYTVFEEVNSALSGFAGEVAPLHQGKTWFEPLGTEAGESECLFDLADHQHAPPGGIEILRRRIAQVLETRHGVQTDAGSVVVTGGATHAIGAVLDAILEPGDEVLVASPQWLFATGVIRAAAGVPVEVPVFAALAQDGDTDFVAMLDEAISVRTKALYLNSPNNPTGKGLTHKQAATLASWARDRDLFVLADNAYEIYDFSPDGFRDIATEAPERTFAIYSFSKTYAIPGARVGFVVCPQGAAGTVRKAGLYSVYSVSTASQRRALRCLDVPRGELDRRSGLARSARDMAYERLVVPHRLADGGLYAWLDLSQWCGGGDGALFVKSAARMGVGLAPGPAFGPGNEDRARLCFTAAPPERTSWAFDQLNALYAGEMA